MFMGEYQHNVDLKGRLIIPSKFREQLGEKVVVTKGLDGCLYLYSMEAWEAFLAKFNSMNLLSPEDRRLKRYFVAGASEGEFDKQGRILLPASLRNAAGIEKDVVLAGMIDYIEIWDKERWEGTSDDVDDIAAGMAKRGIEL